jgi:hypothetical protein
MNSGLNSGLIPGLNPGLGRTPHRSRLMMPLVAPAAPVTKTV